MSLANATVRRAAGRAISKTVPRSTFSVAYADQTERDHQRLCDAIDSGRLPGHADA